MPDESRTALPLSAVERQLLLLAVERRDMQLAQVEEAFQKSLQPIALAHDLGVRRATVTRDATGPIILVESAADGTAAQAST